MIYLLWDAELERLMKISDHMCISTVHRFHPINLLTYFVRKFWKSYSKLILVFKANKIKIVEFTQESVFVLRKLCAEIEREFDVWIWKVHSVSIPSNRRAFDCVKTAVKFKNLKIIVICIPLLFAHIKGKCKFSVNLTLTISIRQIFEFLKQRLI